MPLTFANEIISGRRIRKNEDLSTLTTAPIEALCQGANQIRQALCGNKVDLCTIINGRAGRCREDCKFCAQSAHYPSHCAEHDLVDTDTVLADCRAKDAAGVHAYSIVTAGRSVEGDEFDRLVAIYQALHEQTDLRLCASHGLLPAESFRRLREAGVTMYHANIETSRRYFPQICTTHTYDDKIREIRLAQEAGLLVCSGGIIGMGETMEDRIDMALSLAELGVVSIPINVLMPIPGTPLADAKPLTDEEILRTVALFRYCNPTAYIRIAAGRSRFSESGKDLFLAGANATITGDMLTTTGSNTAQDKTMLTGLGYKL